VPDNFQAGRENALNARPHFFALGARGDVNHYGLALLSEIGPLQRPRAHDADEGKGHPISQTTVVKSAALTAIVSSA